MVCNWYLQKVPFSRGEDSPMLKKISFWREKIQKYSRERCSESIYTVKNEGYELLF